MSRNLEELLTPEFGALLREARETRGLRLEDIAKKLRIQVHYLEAMEAGNLRVLPPNPYRSAFIKQYSKLLGVPLTISEAPQPPAKSVPEVAADVAKATVEAMQSASKATESAVKKSVSQVKDAFDELTSRELWEEAEQVRRERLGLDRPSKPEPAGFSVKGTGERRSYTATPIEETATIEDEYEEMYPAKMSKASKIVVGSLVVATLVVLYLVFFNKSSDELQVVGQSQPVVLQAHKNPPSVEDTVETSPVIAPASTGDSMVLTLSAKEPVWISVTPDDRTGFRGTLEAGMSRTFVAANKYLLYLGNQHALDITFDGKRLSQLPSIPNSKVVVRGLVLTRDRVYTDTATGTKTTATKIQKSTKKSGSDTTSKKSAASVPIRKEQEPRKYPGPVQFPIPRSDTNR